MCKVSTLLFPKKKNRKEKKSQLLPTFYFFCQIVNKSMDLTLMHNHRFQNKTAF